MRHPIIMSMGIVIALFAFGVGAGSLSMSATAAAQREYRVWDLRIDDANEAASVPSSAVAIVPLGDCAQGLVVASEFELLATELACAAGQVNAWLASERPDVPPIDTYYLVPKGAVQVVKPCGYTDMSAFYCRDQNSVYIGEQWLSYRRGGFGTVAILLALGHEATHHVQQHTGTLAIRYSLADTDAESGASVAVEHQADCGAGVFFGWLRQRGMLDDDAIRYGSNMVASMSSADTHGTSDARRRAFLASDGKSMASLALCDRYISALDQAG